MVRRIQGFCTALAVVAFYWTLTRLWRFRHIRYPSQAQVPGPRVYAHWHGDELLMVGAYVRSGMAVMASWSKDGELMKRVLTWLGYRVVRGSSSRGGGAGLKGLIDAVIKEKREASLAVDGPRGPIYKVKPGILMLAQQTGRPLIGAASAAGRRFVFKKAWNQCYLPFPFSKCVIVYGEPMFVPPDVSKEEFEAIRLKLEQELTAMKAEAELLVGGKGELPLPSVSSAGV